MVICFPATPTPKRENEPPYAVRCRAPGERAFELPRREAFDRKGPPFLIGRLPTLLLLCCLYYHRLVERETGVTQRFVPLVEAARTGGTSEVAGLVEAAWPYAYRISYSILHDRLLAEDAAQEACAILFQHIKGLRAAQAFTVWFYRIVVREALAIRKVPVALAGTPEALSSAPLDDALTRIDIIHALMELSATQRICIALNVCGEMSSREIGTVLGIPDSTVRFHIMRAKRMLEKSLKDLNNITRSGERPYGAA